MFLQYDMDGDVISGSNIKPLTSVLPVAKGLNYIFEILITQLTFVKFESRRSKYYDKHLYELVALCVVRKYFFNIFW